MADESKAILWPDTLVACIERDVLLQAERQFRYQDGYEDQIKRGVSDWRWPGMLSQSEAQVFDIDRDIWPRCAVALAAFAHFMDEGNLTSYPEAVYETARKSHAYIYGAYRRGIETFAEFAFVFCSLTEREAYAAFWKEEAWHLREGHRHFIRLGYDPRGADA